MASGGKIRPAIRNLVRQRAGGLCEYCRIVGITAVGRATVVALDLNRERVINIRSADRAVGRHPPTHDPVQKG